MKKKSYKKPRVKQSWVQSTHQWRKDIFVCTGFSAKEIKRAVEKIGSEKWFLDWISKNEKKWQEEIDKGTSFVAREPIHTAFVLVLRPFEDTWVFWEILIHELNHLVDFMAYAQKFEDESEAKAYLQEYLFHQIRRKLTKL